MDDEDEMPDTDAIEEALAQLSSAGILLRGAALRCRRREENTIKMRRARTSPEQTKRDPLAPTSEPRRHRA